MKISFDCVIEKGISKKNNKPYYKLTIVELGKDIFLSDTETKLLSMLHPYTPEVSEDKE